MLVTFSIEPIKTFTIQMENFSPSAEDQTRDVFDLDILEDVIGALQHLFPEVLNYEVTSEEQILKDYTYRPSGLDEELMESWVHLLPDAIDCLELLEGFMEFIQVEDALVEQYPTAKDFCLKYLRMAQSAMGLPFTTGFCSSQNIAGGVQHNGTSVVVQNHGSL